MKIIEFKHWEDFGHEFRLSFIKTQKFYVIRGLLSHSVDIQWDTPNLNVCLSFFTPTELFSVGLKIWGIVIDLYLFKWYPYED